MRQFIWAGKYFILAFGLLSIVAGCPKVSQAPTAPAAGTNPAFPGVTLNNSASVTGWTAFNASGLPTSIIFNSAFSACATTTGAMEVTVGFSTTNQSIAYVDVFPSPYNMSGVTVSSVFEVTGGWNSDAEQLSACLYMVQPVPSGFSGSVSLGTLIGPVVALNSSSSTSTSSGCVTLSLTMPTTFLAPGVYSGFTVANQNFDPTNVGGVGLLILTGNSGGAFGTTVLDIKNWI